MRIAGPQAWLEQLTPGSEEPQWGKGLLVES